MRKQMLENRALTATPQEPECWQATLISEDENRWVEGNMTVFEYELALYGLPHTIYNGRRSCSIHQEDPELPPWPAA